MVSTYSVGSHLQAMLMRVSQSRLRLLVARFLSCYLDHVCVRALLSVWCDMQKFDNPKVISGLLQCHSRYYLCFSPLGEA